MVHTNKVAACSVPTWPAGEEGKMDCRLWRTNDAVVWVLPLAVCPAIIIVQSLPDIACWRRGAPNAATHAETFRTWARHGMPQQESFAEASVSKTRPPGALTIGTDRLAVAKLHKAPTLCTLCMLCLVTVHACLSLEPKASSRYTDTTPESLGAQPGSNTGRAKAMNCC